MFDSSVTQLPEALVGPRLHQDRQHARHGGGQCVVYAIYGQSPSGL